MEEIKASKIIASLDRDLAFDMDSLNELLTCGREILTQAVSISERGS